MLKSTNVGTICWYTVTEACARFRGHGLGRAPTESVLLLPVMLWREPPPSTTLYGPREELRVPVRHLQPRLKPRRRFLVQDEERREDALRREGAARRLGRPLERSYHGLLLAILATHHHEHDRLRDMKWQE